MTKAISYPVTIGATTFDIASNDDIPLANLGGNELVMLYNSIAEKAIELGYPPEKAKTVSRFENRVAAERRCAAMHSAIRAQIQSNAAIAAEGKGPKGPAKVTEVIPASVQQGEENVAKEATTTKVNGNRAKAPKAAKAAKATKAPKAAKVPKEKAAGAGRGRKAAYTDAATIHLLVEGNPKREGSGQHEQWKKYKEGMTVGAFRKALGDAAGPRLYHDTARELIEIREPK